MKGVVQIYKEEENAPYQKLPITVKLPLCLGALVSRQHILTTKYCFGSDKRVTKPGFHYSEKVWEQKGSFCESYNCEAQGKGRAKGRPRKVTQ